MSEPLIQSRTLLLGTVAAPRLRTIVFNLTQGSQGLALGLTLAAASQPDQKAIAF